MKKALLKGLSAILVSYIFLTGCTPINGPDSNEPAKDNELKGNITTSETFKSGKTYYINSTVTVKDGAVLTVETNSVIKFGPKGKLTVRPQSALNAENATFTSYADNSTGEKLICGKDKTPARNDWIGILIDGGKASFTDCTFSYGGNGENPVLQSSSYSSTDGRMKVERCTFLSNGGLDNLTKGTAALKFDTTGCSYDKDNNYVKNCTFEDNIWPLSVPQDFSITTKNTFINNKYDGIYLAHKSNDCELSVINWSNQTVPYCYMSSVGSFTIRNGITLTIEKGTENNPTKVLFSNKGIVINKTGKLNVYEYVTFDKYNENSTFTGILAKAESSTNNKYYTTNESKHIVVGNYIPSQTEVGTLEFPVATN